SCTSLTKGTGCSARATGGSGGAPSSIGWRAISSESADPEYAAGDPARADLLRHAAAPGCAGVGPARRLHAGLLIHVRGVLGRGAAAQGAGDRNRLGLPGPRAGLVRGRPVVLRIGSLGTARIRARHRSASAADLWRVLVHRTAARLAHLEAETRSGLGHCTSMRTSARSPRGVSARIV